MVSFENTGQNLFFQTHAIRIIIQADFFLPLLQRAHFLLAVGTSRLPQTLTLAGLVFLGAATTYWCHKAALALKYVFRYAEVRSLQKLVQF